MSKIKFNRKVLTLATVFALMLTALAFYGTTAGEVYAAGNDVTVTFQAESNDNTFFVKPKEVTVSPGYAATIKSTWTNSSATVGPNGVSALDVLAKIHHNKYGAAFDNNPTAYIRGSASYITGMFGQTNESLPSSGIMFGVNNVQPNDGIVHEWTWNGVTTYGYMTYDINQAKVENGDHVNYFFLKDSERFFSVSDKNIINGSVPFIAGNILQFSLHAYGVRSKRSTYPTCHRKFSA